jgi:hypothetical protein
MEYIVELLQIADAVSAPDDWYAIIPLYTIDRSGEERPVIRSGVRGGLTWPSQPERDQLTRPIDYGLILPCVRRCDAGHGTGAQRQVTNHRRRPQ